MNSQARSATVYIRCFYQTKHDIASCDCAVRFDLGTEKRRLSEEKILQKPPRNAEAGSLSPLNKGKCLFACT